MTEFYSVTGSLPPIPDNLTIVQFMLDYQHCSRPARDDVPCLIEDESGKIIKFEELRESTFGLANALSFKYNLSEDDVALIFSPNHIDYPVAIWAIHRLGGIVTGANPWFTTDELVYQITSSKTSLMIVHPCCLDTALSAARVAGLPSDRIVLFDPLPNYSFPKFYTVRDLIADGLSREPAFVERTLTKGEAKTKLAILCYSSGTTGKPKAVAIPHGALIANIVQMAAHNEVNKEYPARGDRGYRRGDVAIGVLPFYHAAGLIINLHFVLFCAMTLVVIPKYDFLGMLNSIVRHRITHLILVPPQAVALCKHPAVKNYDLSLVKYVMVGAAPLAGEINQKLFDLFPTAHVGQIYGLTEASTTLAMLPVNQQRGALGSGGQLIPGVQAKVIKADGSLAGYGEPGELVVKSPSAALGYAGNDKATSETFVDGWIKTGDKVTITRNREIFVLDRLKEILKVRGFQVAPAEIEGCLLGHPDIAESCVVGVSDDYSGELPLAFVVLSGNAMERVAGDPEAADEIKAAIIKHVADRKVSYKQLTGVEFVDSIPKNPSGKLLRRVLRDQANELRIVVKAKL